MSFPNIPQLGPRPHLHTHHRLPQQVHRHRLPTFEDRPRLAYIDAIGLFPSLQNPWPSDNNTVNETLRWRPGVVGGIPHFIKTEDEYMGFRVPASSTVLPNHFAITRDESVSRPDVDALMPERLVEYMETYQVLNSRLG